MHHQGVGLPIGHKRGDVHAERGTSSKVASCQFTIDVYLAVVIDCSEVEAHTLACPFLRHGDTALVPNVIDKVGISHAREFALWAEGNSNLSIEALALVEGLFHA